MFSKSILAVIGLGALAASAATIPPGSTIYANNSSPAITSQAPYTASQVPSPTSPPPFTPASAAIQTACADLASSAAVASASFASIAAKDSSFTPPGAILVPVEAAVACLVSIPLDTNLTGDFLIELAKYLEFQSTLSYLVNPPEGSDQVPVDLIGGLHDLKLALDNETLSQQTDLEVAIFKLTNSAHEGHLAVQFPLSGNIGFNRPFSIISLSVDGVSEPQIFVLDDITREAGDSTYTAPSITMVNGQNATDYVEEIAFFENAQSPDARYNSMFASINPSGNTAGAFSSPFFFPGSTQISFTYSNGTTMMYDYGAAISLSFFDGFVDVATLYETAIMAPPPSETTTSAPSSASPTLAPRATPAPTDIPLVQYNQPFIDTPEINPYVGDINNLVGGYFLNDTLNTAVINVAGFEATDDAAVMQAQSFQAAVQVFLEEAAAKGSKKLIIDVRGNGGGLIALGYDFYKQLFPTGEAYAGTRLRANTAALIYAGVSAEAVSVADVNTFIADLGFGNGDNLTSAQDVQTANFANGNDYAFAVPLDVNGKHFASVDDFAGPFVTNGDNFTAIATRDLNDPLTFGDLVFSITGFRQRANFTSLPQIFANDDIILLTDGNCASTCTIFSEFLRTEQNISTVVMGGRPNGADSAAIGGTRGAGVTPFSNLLQATLQIANSGANFTAEQLQIFEDNLPAPLPLTLTAGSVNARDNIRKSDTTQTPLQFFLEPADCRLFYTYDTYLSSVALWTYVSNLKWTWDNRPYNVCAVGGLTPGTSAGGDVNTIPGDSATLSEWIMYGWN